MNTQQQHNQQDKSSQQKLSKKLTLSKETIRELTDMELGNVAGGKPRMDKSVLSNCPHNCGDTIGCPPF